MISFLVETRWISRDEPNLDSIPLKHRSKLGLYFQNRRDRKEIETSESDEKILISPKRSYLVYSDLSSSLNRRNRPNYTYGRKSHWDTFFG